MNKLILFCLTTLFAASSFAQNVKFVDYSDNELADTVVVTIDIADIPDDEIVGHGLSVDGNIKDLSDTKPTIAIKREIVDNIYSNDSVELDPWDNGNLKWFYPEDQLCWGMCIIYGIEDVDITSDFYIIGGDLTSDPANPSDLHDVIHFKSYKLPGTTVIKYSIVTDSETLDEMVVKFVVTDLSGISVESARANNFDIYPNPCSSTLNLTKLENVKTIAISNMLGQTVMNVTDVQTNLSLDMSNLNNGVYFTTIITNDNKIYTERIIKR